MKETNCFYDRYGAPRLRLLDDVRLVDFSGRHVGLVHDDALYSYQGVQVAWLEGDIMRDLHGNTIAFGENPTDGPFPYLPYKQYRPYAGYVQYAPYIPYLQYKRYKPYKAYGWSPLDLIELFVGSRENDKK